MHDKKRTVSIIIPTYNRAGFLRDSVESALQQTYPNLEIIVVDDGSTDSTREMLRPHIDSGRIRYLYRKNSGRPSVARNLALRHASGEYICFLDSDDMRREESVARGAEVLDRHHEVGVVCSDWFLFKRHLSAGKKLERSWMTATSYLDRLPKELIRSRDGDLVIFEKDFICEIFGTNFVFTSSVVTRRELLDRVGCFDESLRIGEDCDLWLRVCETEHLAYITEPLAYRRLHSGSITRQLGRNIVDDTKVIEKFLGKRRAMVRVAKERLRRRLEHFYFNTGYFYFMNKDLTESRRRFFKAIRHRPSSFRGYRYFLFSLLPLKAVLLAKRMKRLLG